MTSEDDAARAVMLSDVQQRAFDAGFTSAEQKALRLVKDLTAAAATNDKPELAAGLRVLAQMIELGLLRSNDAVELHDSRINSVRREGGEIVFAVHAMVLVANGRKMTTWTQNVELRLESAIPLPVVDSEVWLHDGSATVDGEGNDNVLDLPFDRIGNVFLNLAGVTGAMPGEQWKFEGSGRRLRVVRLGEPEFLQDGPE